MNGSRTSRVDTTGNQGEQKNLFRAEPSEWKTYLYAIPQPVIILDPRHGVIAVNPAAERALGMREEEILGHPCYKLFHRADQPLPGCPVERLIHEGWTGSAEVEMEAGIFLVSCTPVRDGEGNISQIVHLASDITDLKRTQAALQKSEEWYRVHFESTYDMLISIDDRGRIVSVSPSVEAVLGYKPERFHGQSLAELDIFTPSSKDAVSAGMGLIMSGEKIRGGEYTCRDRNGREKTIEANVSPVVSDEGRITGVLVTARDITERVASEKAILDSERSLRAILSASPIGISRVKDRAFEWVNETLSRMSGYSSGELTGKSIRILCGTSEEFQRIGNLLQRSEGQVETKLVRKDGVVLDVMLEVSPTDSNSHILTVTDMTRQKETENELRLARFTVDNAIDSIFLLEADGKIVYANDAASVATGYSREELLGKSIFELDVDLNEGMWAERWPERKRRPNMSMESRFARRDGTLFPIEVRSYYLEYLGREYVCANVRDITERKRAEEALHESEVKYRTVVESSLVGFYIIQDGKFRFVNRRFCEIYGYGYEEIIDKLGPLDLAHPEDRDKVRENIRRRLCGESDRIEYTFRTLRKDGAQITVKVIGSALNYNGRPAATGNLIDITREETLESQLRQARKMEALGTLAGGIAHDFNNILTVISGYGSLLKMATENTSPLRAYVEPILSSSEKAAGLTRSLLAFSRQQPITLTPLNINKSIRGTEKLLKRLLTEDVELVASLASGELIVMADPTQMEQILFNLATNARDAMQKGGRLVIETRLVELDREYVNVHGYGAPGMFAMLLVSDTGTGMDSATREKIFDPFFTTKEMGRGTGLGLSTVYGIVKQHNGYIDVYSEPGVGTAFHIYFPVAQEAALEEKAPAPSAERGTETILVAEDNEDVMRLVRSILTRHGYTVIEALDGLDAVEKFRGHPEIDLVILDSVMPRKNGREVCDEVRAMRPDIKVIFTSGYTRDIVLDKGIETKEVDFLSKPILPEHMLNKVREVLDR